MVENEKKLIFSFYKKRIAKKITNLSSEELNGVATFTGEIITTESEAKRS
jgi:hypothetical protein